VQRRGQVAVRLGERRLGLEQPAAGGHLVGQVQHVDPVRAVLGHGHQGRHRIPDDPDAGDVGDAADEGDRRLVRLHGQVAVAVGAQQPGDRPGGGHRSGGAGAGQGRVHDRVTRPAGGREPVRLPQFGRGGEQHRDALGRVAVLVQVDRHRRHAGHRQVEPLGDVVQERQDPAADAGIHVARDPGRGGQGGHLADRVEHAVRIGRGADHDQRRPLVQQVGDGGDVGPAGDRVDRHVRDLEIEQMGRLAERGVRGHRQEQPGAPGAAVPAPALPGGEDRQQAALRAAAGQRADRVGPAAEQCERGADQVVLDPGDAGEGGRVEGVGPLERGLGGRGQRLDVVAPGVVDVGHGGAAVGRDVAGLQRGELGEYVLRAHSGSSSW
jgi:hypothetical protein